jgi:HSP20 family protein
MVFQCTDPAYVNRIDREMNRLLSSFFGNAPEARQRPSGSAAVNLWEKDDAWMVEIELPGVAAEDVDLSVVDDELTISVERPELDTEGATYFRRERPRGSYARTLQLPAAVDAENVEAALTHGVLTVTLPKADAARRRKIQVKPGE